MSCITDGEMKDLFVIAFQIRDIRGGKGEREIFTELILELLVRCVDKAGVMIRLIPEYGCWKDLWSLWNATAGHPGIGECVRIRSAIDDYVCEQFRKDWVTLDRDGDRAKLSLLAKWLPREGGACDHLSLHFAQKLFPSIPCIDDRRRAYRKACSEMNMYLKTVEVNMCGGKWADISPKGVPSRTMYRNKNAFLNLAPQNEYHKAETVNDGYHKIHKKGYVKNVASGKTVNELRHPHNEDRMKCRDNFIYHIETAKKAKVSEALDSARYDAVREAFDCIDCINTIM